MCIRDSAYRDKLDAGQVTADVVKVAPDPLTPDWGKLLQGKLDDKVNTTFPRAKLDALAKQINTIPPEITLHPRVAKIYDDRLKMAAGEQPGDWGFAENLAYATLLTQDYRLRLVGQDSGRGVDPLDPQATEVTLAGPAVAVGAVSYTHLWRSISVRSMPSPKANPV